MTTGIFKRRLYTRDSSGLFNFKHLNSCMHDTGGGFTLYRSIYSNKDGQSDILEGRNQNIVC